MDLRVQAFGRLLRLGFIARMDAERIRRAQTQQVGHDAVTDLLFGAVARGARPPDGAAAGQGSLDGVARPVATNDRNSVASGVWRKSPPRASAADLRTPAAVHWSTRSRSSSTLLPGGGRGREGRIGPVAGQRAPLS